MDRQTIIDTNRSLRLIKNELESLLEKGVINDSAFDSITAALPAELPLSGAAPVRGSNTSTPAPAQSASPAPARTANASPAPPSYAQSTATPPSLPHRNAAPADAKPVLAHARALYRYAATDARDCSFDRDDRIAVHEYMNADWWMGRNLRTGQEGIFPRSYVAVEQADEKRAPAAYHQPQYAAPAPAAGHYGGYPGVAAGYPPAPVPYGTPQPQQQQQPPPGEQPQEGGDSKVAEHGKNIGKKLGNAAIFGAGATLGSNIVNSIF